MGSVTTVLSMLNYQMVKQFDYDTVLGVRNRLVV